MYEACGSSLEKSILSVQAQFVTYMCRLLWSFLIDLLVINSLIYVLYFFQDALELRIYLHDRSLMEYADRLEGSGISLIDLISTSPSLLVSQYGMRRVHVARFIDRSMACGIQMPPNLTLQPTRRRSMEEARSTRISTTKSEAGEVPTSPSPSPPPSVVAMSMKEFPSTETKSITETPLTESKSPSSPLPESKSPRSPLSETQPTLFVPSTPPSVDGQSETGSGLSQLGFENPSIIRPIGAKKPNAHKGVFSAPPAPARMCGLVAAQQVGDDVTQLPVMERVYVRKLAPEHRQGCDPWTMKEMKMPPPFKASELWADKATLLFCLRRPGYVLLLPPPLLPLVALTLDDRGMQTVLVQVMRNL